MTRTRKITEIYEGTSEVQMMVTKIAREEFPEYDVRIRNGLRMHMKKA